MAKEDENLQISLTYFLSSRKFKILLSDFNPQPNSDIATCGEIRFQTMRRFYVGTGYYNS